MSNAATGLGKVVADFQKRFPDSEAKFTAHEIILMPR